MWWRLNSTVPVLTRHTGNSYWIPNRLLYSPIFITQSSLPGRKLKKKSHKIMRTCWFEHRIGFIQIIRSNLAAASNPKWILARVRCQFQERPGITVSSRTEMNSVLLPGPVCVQYPVQHRFVFKVSFSWCASCNCVNCVALPSNWSKLNS